MNRVHRIINGLWGSKFIYLYLHFYSFYKAEGPIQLNKEQALAQNFTVYDDYDDDDDDDDDDDYDNFHKAAW